MRRTDHETIQQVLDGSISQQDFVGFQQRMRTEPEFSKLYGDYALLHHSLCEEFEGQPVSNLPVPVSRSTPVVRWLWIAAAAVVVMAGVLFYQGRSPVAAIPPLIAEVRFSADAVWQIDGDAGKSGSDVARLPLGATLQLLQGQANLSPNDKASALIVGPSSLTFVSPESLHLADGRGRFRLEDAAGKLEVTTPSLSAVDLGTEFGIESHRDQPDELHVIDGKIQLRINGKTDSQILVTGEAARISGADSIQRFKADPERFPKRLAEFKTVSGGPFVKSDWRVEYGKPSISADRINGVNYSAFRSLPEISPNEKNPVLLASLAVESPSTGQFHTDGWAGMSFFSKGVELLFFGDSFGPERTWSLDVKQRIPVILPGNPVVGPRTVTLRYDYRTGEVSLHAGAVPLGAPFCSGKLPAGTAFDEIRLGASSSAALAIRSLVIQVGGGQ
jgi:hypothetical protein